MKSNLTHLPGFHLVVLQVLHIEIIFLIVIKETNQLVLRLCLDKLVIVVKGLLNCYGKKTKESIVSEKVSSCVFWCITNSIVNRIKSAILPLFNGLEVSISASEKAKLSAELFSKNSNLDDSGYELPSFSCKTDITLSNVVITPKMVKKAICILDSSKTSGPDGIPVIVLKNCEPELSFIQTDLFNLCLKELSFPDCWKFLSVVLVFKNVDERSDPKNYCPVSLVQ